MKRFPRKKKLIRVRSFTGKPMSELLREVFCAAGGAYLAVHIVALLRSVYKYIVFRRLPSKQP